MPNLPPTGGPAIASAGRLTADNFAAERVAGPASQGLIGDYFLRNDKVRLVVQAPGRAIGPCPFGGNVIDFDRVDAPAGDQLGEVSAFLQLGRTLRFDRAEVVRDGKAGGPAVLRFWGQDAQNDYINVAGLGGFALGIEDDYRAAIDLHLQAAVTYILMPGESKLRMIYTMYNDGARDEATTWGTLSDTGAQIETFHPGRGFGETQLNDIAGGLGGMPGPYGAFLARGIAYGIVPVGAATAAFTVAGVDVEVVGVQQVVDALGPDGTSLAIDKHGTASREIDLVLGPDIAGVTAAALAVGGTKTTPFQGTTEPGARVLVADAAGNAVTVANAGSDGAFAGALPDGDYTIQAEGDGYRRSPSQPLSLHGTAASATLAVPPSAALAYTIRDDADQPSPGKISIVGAPANPPDRRFRDNSLDSLPYGIAAWGQSRAGDSTHGDHWDHPIALAPGHYRVVVSRGPEWTRFEEELDVPAGGARFDAKLSHVAPTPGYVAADFHQHTYMSPDAPVPPEDRLMSYIVDGADFISSSDHDFHFDYAPLIQQLGLTGLIDSAVGVETTPWDYGHFIGWPLAVDDNSPNHGAFDWGNAGAGYVPPGGIFAALRSEGAQVVQVNHPRAPAGYFSNFQQNFDRAGLSFDFATRSFGGNAAAAPLSALELGFATEAPLFDDHFDSVEVYNGFHLGVSDDERADLLVDTNLRDWMNFLSFGFTPTAVGDSDSHQWFSVPSGLPRTLVAVPDDSAAALAAGVVSEVAAVVSGKQPRDVIVTNGPFVQLHVDGAGIGRTVAHTGTGPLAIHVDVTAADWTAVDTVEIFANETFDVPSATPQPLQPAICFTSKMPASMRCAMALLTQTFNAPPIGGKQTLSLDAAVTVDQLLARVRPGATGRDLWLVARVSGTVSLFPTAPLGMDASLPDLIAGHTADHGITPLAFTNPVYVDGDGNGWRAPFAP